jgi:hypothetical protein
VEATIDLYKRSSFCLLSRDNILGDLPLHVWGESERISNYLSDILTKGTSFISHITTILATD